MNDADWTNVAEEIETVGLYQLHSVESFLRLVLTHLLKLYAWPDSEACSHWRGEIVVFQAEATRRFSPSMTQRINVGGLYATSVKQLQAIDQTLKLPAENPLPSITC